MLYSFCKGIYFTFPLQREHGVQPPAGAHPHGAGGQEAQQDRDPPAGHLLYSAPHQPGDTPQQQHFMVHLICLEFCKILAFEREIEAEEIFFSFCLVFVCVIWYCLSPTLHNAFNQNFR